MTNFHSAACGGSGRVEQTPFPSGWGEHPHNVSGQSHATQAFRHLSLCVEALGGEMSDLLEMKEPK